MNVEAGFDEAGSPGRAPAGRMYAPLRLPYPRPKLWVAPLSIARARRSASARTFAAMWRLEQDQAGVRRQKTDRAGSRPDGRAGNTKGRARTSTLSRYPRTSSIIRCDRAHSRCQHERVEREQDADRVECCHADRNQDHG